MEFAEQLKSAVDIVTVVGERVPLKRRGAHSFVGLCPFHQEKSGSFHVQQAQQFYKCFGCGAGGDVIKFVMEYEHMTFVEAITMLSERFGVPMPQRTQESDAESRLRAALMEMHEIAARHFSENLAGPAGAEARQYLERRGVDVELAREFRLGFSMRGADLVRLLERRGFAAGLLEESGLAGKREDGSFYDRFRGRLMFPICNETGKVIAFGARAMAAGDEPKYLNSPGTAIYQKSHVLYNIHRAKDAGRKSGRVVLVEGYMDVIGAWAAGVADTVAPCGTALTPQQVRIMKRFAGQAVVNFDPDEAGANAAEKSIQLLIDEGFKVRVATLEGGLDPDEYVRANGAEAYCSRLEQAPNYYHWLAQRARQRFNVRTSEGKVEALEFLLPAVRRLGDRVERAALAGEMAAMLGIEQGLLLDQFRRAASSQKAEKILAPSITVPPVEKLLLELVLHSGEVRDHVLGQLEQYPKLRQSQAAEIWAALGQMRETGYSWGQLEGKLSAASKSLMEALAFADHIHTDQNLVEQANACLAQLDADNRRAHVGEWKKRIREAEQSGDISAALELAAQFHEWEKSS